MFGVALELKISHFQQVLKTPVPIITGLISQFLLLPAVTYILIIIFNPSPSVAMGMIMVAACPGGNVSNFFSMMSRGNVALSVSITAISTLLCFLMTPFTLSFWGGMYSPTQELLKGVNLDFLALMVTIFTVLIIPLVLGMLVSAKKAPLAECIKSPIRKLSLLIFAAFVIGALAANRENFINYVGAVVGLVALHNAMALLTGYFTASVVKLPLPDRRSISIEIGIQNSGLGLVLIFDFFNGLGGMAIVAAWWGVWHLISGMLLSFYWSKKKTPIISA
ncbi:MAG: bile acid:sodium symporter family protein [Cyclobacteriaceae bacterium]